MNDKQKETIMINKQSTPTGQQNQKANRPDEKDPKNPASIEDDKSQEKKDLAQK